MKIPFLLLSLATSITLSAFGNEPDVIKNDLRAPAYPLVTIDPYMSAWSGADNLYDAPVMHWTTTDLPFIGVLKVDGVPYRFMGTETFDTDMLVPTSQQGEGWQGRYVTSRPADGWNKPDFDDSSWTAAPASFGTTKYIKHVKTDWSTPEIWVRREIEIPAGFPEDKPVFLQLTNNDDAVFYINGVKIFDTGSIHYTDKLIRFPETARAALHTGKNILAAECQNPRGSGILDFGLRTPQQQTPAFDKTATQISADVQATQTHYRFKCGPVNLAVDFMAPVFLDSKDYDLLSRPVNYINYSVSSADGKKHDVEIYFEASPRWATGTSKQESESVAYSKNGIAYLRTAGKDQPVLQRSGDHVLIDWGYFYLAAPESQVRTQVGEGMEMRHKFIKNDRSLSAQKGGTKNGDLAIIRDFGKIKNAEGHVMVGFDDIYSIQYFGENLRPYWNRRGDRTIESQFEAAEKERKDLISRSYAFDKRLMQEAIAAGGKKYADLAALAYRQAIAAHKLVESPSGELFLFSKENDSNGSIGTVDITYPTAPLLLYYNPELAKATMNFIFEYSESGKWNKPFPSHDVGTYPKANGQTYPYDMPVEEGGNMIILTDAICQLEKNPEYARKHWKVLTDWVGYLVKYGLDPENQVCTDDFAGHFAHNVNLSAKAIEGIAAYSDMARMLGKTDVADKYLAIAKDYARQWKENAREDDHYRLSFDRPGTWSQKYNLIWDKVLGFDIFDPQIFSDEVKYYQKVQNKYGVPLDNRATYSKTDWILWSASLADNREDFDALVDPVYLFMNTTDDRVPMTDWPWTDRPRRRGFMARAVVGGVFMPMLKAKMMK